LGRVSSRPREAAYRQNDARAAVKRAVSRLAGPAWSSEKSDA